MKTITTNVYTFQELLDLGDQTAIDNARQWLREAATDHDWWEYTYELWQSALEQVGFTDPKIAFSGFSCQGDGASFTSGIDVEKIIDFLATEIEPKNCIEGDPEDFRPWVRFRVCKLTKPEYRSLHDLSGKVERTDHRYSHALTCHATIEGGDSKLVDEFEADVEQLRRDLCGVIYIELEEDYEYQTGDEAIKEFAESNEYTFTEYGRRFG